MEPPSEGGKTLADTAANLRAARQRVEKLRHELRVATQEEKATLNSFESTLDQYSRSSCMQLVQRMHAKLPAELRTVVYEYLFIEDRPIPVGPLYHFRRYYGAKVKSGSTNLVDSLSKDRVKLDHSRELPADMVTPESFLFDANYVGETFVSEATKVYYSKNTFSVCHVEDAVSRFLFPQGQIGGRGPDVHLVNNLRSLQIRLKAEGFLELDDEMEELIDERTFLYNCYASLKPVIDFVKSAVHKINIEIIIMTELFDFLERYRERAFANILQAIRRPVYTLIHESDAIVKIIAYDEGLSPFPRNVTGLFSLTKDQWQFENEKLLEKYALHPQTTRIYHTVEDGYVFPHKHRTVVESQFGEYAHEHMEQFIRHRWGVDLLLKGIAEPKYPIIEGYYWPTRREHERGTKGSWQS